ncbi:MAG: hypothetical protein KDA65_08375 [Planctomycetaceae bacterium]|nr:hypothetical protein [Planctomycetaceae bacterium]
MSDFDSFSGLGRFLSGLGTDPNTKPNLFLKKHLSFLNQSIGSMEGGWTARSGLALGWVNRKHCLGGLS